MARSVVVAFIASFALVPAAHASFPGRDGSIALSEPRAALRIVSPAGKTVTRFGAPFTFTPRWSADGRRIAYVTGEDVADFAVFVASADGSGAARVPLPFPAVDPAWAPDGRSLLVTRVRGPRGERRDVYRVALDGSGLRSLIPNALEPVWSPDGERIAYVALRADGCRRLAVADADGADRTIVADRIRDGAHCDRPAVSLGAVSEGGNVFMPDWRPDGRRLVYASDGAARELDLMTGRTRILARARTFRGRPGKLLWPHYSPSGRRLLFCDGRGNGSWQASTVPLGGSKRTAIGSGTYPDWQPLP